MGRKPTKQTKPAPTVSKHSDLAKLESPMRQMIYVIKKFFSEGEDAGLREITELKREGFDPINASMGATVSVQLLDPRLAHADKFTQRKSGSVSPETKYIRALSDDCPSETASGIWNRLRLAAQNEIPGCPFRITYPRGKPVLVGSRGRELKRKTFDNKLSAYRSKKSPAHR